jgi:8-hydroxy-5-deazaflavin:NADPH oxidoreductase
MNNSATTISIIGTGDMGAAIATALRQRTRSSIKVRGSQVGSVSAAKLVKDLGVAEATDQDITESDVVFVVVPAVTLKSAIAALNSFTGIVVSVAVSSSVGRDGLPSCAEQIAAALPRAKVVNAFTSVWSSVVRDPGSGEKTSVFVCSDDDTAKDTISRLVEEAGFEPIDGGKLSVALYAEVLGMFAVRLALDSGYGQRISFRAFKAGS